MLHLLPVLSSVLQLLDAHFFAPLPFFSHTIAPAAAVVCMQFPLQLSGSMPVSFRSRLHTTLRRRTGRPAGRCPVASSPCRKSFGKRPSLFRCTCPNHAIFCVESLNAKFSSSKQSWCKDTSLFYATLNCVEVSEVSVMMLSNCRGEGGGGQPILILQQVKPASPAHKVKRFCDIDERGV